MSQPNTSAVYTVWDVLEHLLATASWPHVPEEPNGVAVWFGDAYVPPGDGAEAQPVSSERVVLISDIETPDEQWGPMGQFAREERFVVRVFVYTAIPSRTIRQVRARLEELTATVEGVIRDINASRRGGNGPAEFARFPSWHLQMGALNPNIGPTPDGAVGTAVLDIRCEFRVGTPPVQP